MLAAVVAEKNFESASNSIKKANGADLIELRLDYIEDFEVVKLKRLLKNCKNPVIVTNRKKGEGGFFKGGEKERIQILKKSIDSGADYIDIELSSGINSVKELIKNKKKSKIIVSYHDFYGDSADIIGKYNEIKKLKPDLIKIVTKAGSVTGNFKIFDLIKKADKENRKIIAFCMGSYGEFGRILSIILGSRIIYASLSKGKESASGQFTLDELNSYRIKKLDKNTKIAGLIGNPVEHSWSHIMHNAAFDRMDVNAVYLKFRVDKLKEFIDYFRKLNCIGFGVTIPHKINVIRYIDGIDKKAKEIGAVNTIVAKKGKLTGYNTDCYGAIQSLKQRTKLKNRNVVVLGAGGSSRAITYGLLEENANVTVLNRTLKNAKLIANDFDCGYGSLYDLKNINYDILVNTTPVGMHPDLDKSPVPLNLVRKGTVVFDIVFNPYKTKILKYAEKKGCVVVPGIEMLVNGNVLQFKLWTGKNAPEQFMRKKIMEYLKNVSHQN